jgi:hypothetical protein
MDSVEMGSKFTILIRGYTLLVILGKLHQVHSFLALAIWHLILLQPYNFA